MNGENLPRQDRKMLLSGCTLFPPNCIADVTGTVSDMMLGNPTLVDASLNWTKKPSNQANDQHTSVTQNRGLEEMIERTKKEQQMNGQH
jgi:hypothetical protein